MREAARESKAGISLHFGAFIFTISATHADIKIKIRIRKIKEYEYCIQLSDLQALTNIRTLPWLSEIRSFWWEEVRLPNAYVHRLQNQMSLVFSKIFLKQILRFH